MALVENEPNYVDKIAFVYGPGQLLDKRSKTTLYKPANEFYTNYTASYANAFPVTDNEKTVAYRPMTSNAFRNPYNLSDPIGASHYDETYYKKTVVKEEPIRTGTSSGNRNNHPHPSKEFMVFRFRPMKPVVNYNSDWSQSIGDTLLTQVIKNQMKSTYASDYINNVEEKARFDERAKQVLRPSTAVQKYTAKKKRQQELDESVAPMTYNHPFTYESLHLSPTRLRKAEDKSHHF